MADLSSDNCGQSLDDSLAMSLDRVSDGIFVLDDQWNLTFVNEAAARMSGSPPSELLGHNFWELHPGWRGTEIEEKLRLALEQKRVVEVEAYSMYSHHWFSARAFPSDTGLICFYRDVSGQVRAAGEIRTAEAARARLARLLSVVASSNEILLRSQKLDEAFVDVVEVAVGVGEFKMAWVGLLDEKATKVVPWAWAGSGAETYLSGREFPVGRDSAPSPARLAVQSRSPWRVQDISVDPTLRQWRDRASRFGYRSVGLFPLVGESGVLGLLCIYAAETGHFDDRETALGQRMASNLAFAYDHLLKAREVEAYQAEQAQADRLAALSQMAGGMAHDFKTLIGLVLNYAALAKRRVHDPQVTADLESITTVGERAALLVDRLVTCAGYQPSELRIIDVGELVTGVGAMLAPTLERAGVGLRISVGDGAAAVLGDSLQLEQVILNVLANSRDATPRGGTIGMTVGTETPPEPPASTPLVVVTVTDDGCGMDPDVSSRAFEPFFTTKFGRTGTGLGLASAYGIVQAHGGAMDISSRRGAGTTVVIKLRALPAGVSVAGNSGERPDAQLVLVVEDDPEVRERIGLTLVEGGYRVVVAGQGNADDVLERLNGQVGAVLSVATADHPDLEGLSLGPSGRRPHLALLGEVDDAEILRRLGELFRER